MNCFLELDYLEVSRGGRGHLFFYVSLAFPLGSRQRRARSKARLSNNGQVLYDKQEKRRNWGLGGLARVTHQSFGGSRQVVPVWQGEGGGVLAGGGLHDGS